MGKDLRDLETELLDLCRTRNQYLLRVGQILIDLKKRGAKLGPYLRRLRRETGMRKASLRVAMDWASGRAETYMGRHDRPVDIDMIINKFPHFYLVRYNWDPPCILYGEYREFASEPHRLDIDGMMPEEIQREIRHHQKVIHLRMATNPRWKADTTHFYFRADDPFSSFGREIEVEISWKDLLGCFYAAMTEQCATFENWPPERPDPDDDKAAIFPC